MPAVLERTSETNDLGYPEVNARTLKPRSDFILVQWQNCQPNIQVGKFILARPDTHTKMHYVGNVIAAGPDVDPKIRPGMRLVFDQFSNFEKYWDEVYGRVALLQESIQGYLFMIVPKRVKIEGQEPEYDLDA